MERDRVAILGMQMYNLVGVPWQDDTVEKWGINEAYVLHTEEEMSKFTRWFQLHPRWDWNRKTNKSDPEHRLWMRRKHPFPVYMQKVYKSTPAGVLYPSDEIIERFGRRYFTSTFAYQVALALYEGFKEIQIFGMELLSWTEMIEDQRGCLEYWLGRAEGMGVTVTIPPSCKLLGQHLKLYALEKRREIHRHHIESMRNRADRLRQQHLIVLRDQEGQYTDDERVKAARWMDINFGKAMAAQELLDELDDIRYGDRKERI